MPVRKKSPSKMLASLAKRPDHNKMNKIKKLTNLSNLKTNQQRRVNNITPKFQRLSLREKRNRELNVAKNIIERVRSSSPVQRRRVIKMMRELGFKPLNKP
jgi:ribosome recycling factor